ncbi:thyroid adenoma-associated protein homolog [Uloborus diversus]|uniref:thyroid adenoma-associated protein homolog n=1 Tax=Uloborus diversus TaxID=327109 RepID=UPI00240A42EF|nr:thyroid adenoma-associated protein homolog [Uloborus diversus]
MDSELSRTFAELSEFYEKIAAESSTAKIHLKLKELYRLIQQYQFKTDQISSFKTSDLELFLSVVKYLLKLIINQDSPADLILLSSTCLALLSCGILSAETSPSFLILVLHIIGECEGSLELVEKKLDDAFGLIKSNNNHNALQSYSEEYLQEVKSRSKLPSFGQLAILHGMISTQKQQLFAAKIVKDDYRPFLVTLFDSLHFCCVSLSSMQFHTYSTLLNWLRMCVKYYNEIFSSQTQYFSPEGEVTWKLLPLLEASWQSPVKGINGLVKEIYRLIISLSKTEKEFQNLSGIDLTEYLLSYVLKMNWKVKGKYLVLSVILQHVPYDKFFQENPEAPSEIVFNLKANYSSSIIGEVYKILVSKMMESNDPEKLCSEWSRWWKKPILDALHSDDKLLVQNIINIILPWTMKCFPESYKLLLKNENKTNIMAVQLSLLRVAKESGAHGLQKQDIKLLSENLHHCDTQIRSEVLSTICSSPKKSASLSSEELQLVMEFIEYNMNIDSASFHQQLLAQLRTLLVRIRDSLAQEYRLKSKSVDFELDLAQIGFIECLLKTTFKNLYPGACYQRRNFCLQVLNMAFEVFVEIPTTVKRKEKPSRFVQLVITWAQNHNMWLAFKNKMLWNIIPCMTDFTDEIRSVTAGILLEHASLNTADRDSDAIYSVNFLSNFASTLCSNPDYRSNDGGAHLYRILFKIYCKETENVPDSKCNRALSFLINILKEASIQFMSAKENFYVAASCAPIHGFLLALQYCISDSKDVLKQSSPNEVTRINTFIATVINLCKDIIHYMLNIMKGSDDIYNCPSFFDIGQALRNLLPSINVISTNSTIENSLDDVNTAAEVDLMLSCCWHSIKNSCFLLCEISSIASSMEMDCILKEVYVLEIAGILFETLTKCRHRGVVEACSLALNTFCLYLSNDGSLHEKISKLLLKSALNSLSDTSTSVTRRSAGLPLLFQAVVCSETNNINRKLLSYAVEELLNLISSPLLTNDVISNKNDLPHAHAYHILKALVMDSSLSQAILSHIASIIPVCISGFSSPYWPIRNGALQLFGVLLPRVCGQKKERSDDSEHNLISPVELFARCPGLKAYLLQQLRICIEYHQKNQLSSELIPILSIIVKLSPQQRDAKESIADFEPMLFDLLDIPVWKVRDLISSVLSQSLSIDDVHNLLRKIKEDINASLFKCNRIHSILLTIQKFLRKMKPGHSCLTKIQLSLADLYLLVSKKTKVPLLLGTILKTILLSGANEIPATEENILCFEDSSVIGSDYFLCQTVKFKVLKSKMSSIPGTVKDVMEASQNVKIICLNSLSTRWSLEEKSGEILEEDKYHWKQIFELLMNFILPSQHPSVRLEALMFMISLCSHSQVGIFCLDSAVTAELNSKLQYYLDLKAGFSESAVSLTMLSLSAKADCKSTSAHKSKWVQNWISVFHLFAQPRSSDVRRMHAAQSLSIIGPFLVQYLSAEIKAGSDNALSAFIGLCEDSILLLQDEDEDIRTKACEFPSNLSHKYEVSQLYFHLCKNIVCELLYETLQSHNYFILYLWNQLQNYPSTSKILQSCNRSVKMNLFEQEYVNVFAEPIQLIFYYHSFFIKMMEKLFEQDYDLWEEKTAMFLRDLKVDLEDTYLILSSINWNKLNQNFTYHHRVFLALTKLFSLVNGLLRQEFLISTCDKANHFKQHFQEISDCWMHVQDLLPPTTIWLLRNFLFL